MALAELNVRIGAITAGFEKSLRGVNRSLRKFQRDVEGVGRNLTSSLTLPIIGVGAAAVKSFSDIERLTKAMETAIVDAGGSVQDAREELDALREAAQNPGLAFEQAVKGSVRLQAVGLEASQARETLLAFGNALALAGGTAADLDGVTLALTQIASKGKISAEEINQIAERVPQIRRVLQQAFGTASSEDLQKLGVSAEEFISKVTSEFQKLPRAQETLSNAFNNLGQSVRQALADIGQEIVQVTDLGARIRDISEFVSNAAASFRNLDDETKRSIIRFAAITASIGPALLIMGKLAGAARTAIGVFSLLNSAFTGAAKGAINAAAAIRTLNAASALAAGGALIAITGAVALAVSAFSDFKKRVEQANAAQNAIKRVARDAEASISQERTEVKSLVTLLEDENASRATKQNALQRLQQINPQYFGQLRLEKDTVEGLTEATNKYIDALVLEARIKTTISALADVQNQLSDTAKVAEDSAPSFAQTFTNALISAGSGAGFIGRQFQTLGDNTGRAFTALEDQAKALQDQLQSLQRERAGLGGDADGGVVSAPTFERAGAGASEVQKILDELNADLSVINRKSEAFGNTFDVNTEKTKVLADALKELLSAGLSGDAAIVQNITGQIDELRGSIDAVSTLPSLDLIPQKLASVSEATALASASLENLGANTQFVNEFMTGYQERLLRAQEITQSFNQSLTGLIEGGLAGIGTTFAETIGKIASGTGTLRQLFGGLLNSLVGVLKEVGKLAIETGIALLGIKTALKSLNPVVAIAAGIALIAVASAVQARLKNVAEFAEGGLVFGPTLALVGEGPGTSRTNPEVIAPLDQLRGLIEGRKRTGMVIAEARISGDDLLLLIRDAEERENRTS